MHASALPPYLDLEALARLLDAALQEDLGPGGVASGDVTTLATIPGAREAEARFLLKEDGVVAGLYVATQVFARVDADLNVQFSVEEGSPLLAGTVFGTVQGRARSVLVAERLALNLVQRMSGIATATRRYVDAVAGTGCRVLDTRKTAPGLRALDKWAVLLGGGENHRVGLYDRILVKDNHVEAAGGTANALRAAKLWRDAHASTLEIEVEVRTLEEVRAALSEGGADYLLLDNMARRTPEGGFDVSLLASAVELVNGRIHTEASGNVSLDTVRAIAETGVDFVSVG
ncbi:MAG TPA: carboxylating nicotinate-nucleotide diphosphorylase, partial [Rhodothermales bacterium]|nr:carboxylating nicotinate-nucleotide diphosphorylase [Rhodothermales bacterium]